MTHKVKPNLEGVDYDRHLKTILSTLHPLEDPLERRTALYGYLVCLEQTYRLPAVWLIIYSTGRDFYEEMTKHMTDDSVVNIQNNKKPTLH